MAQAKSKQAAPETESPPQLMGLKVRLEPTVKQRAALVQHAGAARFAYNWGLELRQKAYAYTDARENAISLHKLLNSLKKNHYPWMYEVSKCAMQEALRDLDQSYKNWFRRLGEGKSGRQAGAPHFKSRTRDGIGSFRLTCPTRLRKAKPKGAPVDAVMPLYDKMPMRVEREGKRAYICLPRIGRVRLSENARFPEGPLGQVTVSEHAGHWYVSAQAPARASVKLGQRPRQEAPEGVDLGLSAWVTFADGEKISAPKPLRRAQRKLRRLERQKSRRKLDSKNRAKTRARIAKLHARVANQRADATHKLTTMLATTRSSLVIEDLNARGMAKNHSLARSIQDAAFGEIRRQLTYKCAWYGCGLELAPRFYPSTQKCSGCGLVKVGDEKLTLSQRTFRCAGCGLVIDRDENAGKNLAALWGSKETKILVAASCAETQNACGAGSSGRPHERKTKLPAMKQEPGCAVEASLVA